MPLQCTVDVVLIDYPFPNIYPHDHVFASASLLSSISSFSIISQAPLLSPWYSFFSLPSSTLHYSMALYWNCSTVQILGWKQAHSPPAFLPNNTFHFLPHCLSPPTQPLTSPSLLSLAPCFHLFLLLRAAFFLSKANTIIHTEMSLYSCIKWNLFKLTRSLTCILELPNMLTRMWTKYILLFLLSFCIYITLFTLSQIWPPLHTKNTHIDTHTHNCLGLHLYKNQYVLKTIWRANALLMF